MAEEDLTYKAGGSNANFDQTGQESGVVSRKVGQDQIHGLLFGDRVSWQSIIYDLINTEQLDPWDVDLVLLSNRYLEKIRELEEENFFISSKVLLAAALLLRIKSEILLNRYIPSLDEILFGKKEEKHYVQERLELDEEIPDLIPRTPLPRSKKVTLEELMTALGKAIKTETRRIKRVVVQRQQEIETSISLPKKGINIQDSIRQVYNRLKGIFSERNRRLAFSEISGKTSEERVATFVPLLHLDNQHKVVLEQEGHLEEIWIWLKSLYDKEHKEELEKLRREVEEDIEKFPGNESEDEIGEPIGEIE